MTKGFKSVVWGTLVWLSLLWGLAIVQAAQYANASGGDEVYEVDVDGTSYRVHVFTNLVTTNFTVLNAGPVEYLVVGGGGGGGTTMGGGGGGGGVVQELRILTTGDYQVVVGAGGLGGYAYNLAGQAGQQGNNSSFRGLVALGGGGGAGWSGHPSTSGGSGGGGNSVNSASAGTDGQGYEGDIGSNAGGQRSGGGGGGASEKGDLGIAGVGGKGGDGVGVFGATYGGGGGGGLEGSPVADGGGAGGLGGGGAGSRGTTKAIDGLPNTGGGGGGAGYHGTGTGRIGGHGGSGIVVVRYPLDGLDGVKFMPSDPLTLANVRTGSTRFTNTNEVEVVGFPVPDGCTHFQITESGDVTAVDDGAWLLTDQPPTIETFTLPAADTNITLYAWFTNTAESVWLQRAEGSLVYTTVLPEPVSRTGLQRGIIEGETVAVLSIMDIDAGSTGGTYDMIELDISGRSLFCAADATPELPEVTLNALGSYDVILTVTNEAGNTAVATSTVNVVSSGTYTYYVDINNFGNDAPPYNSWSTAATNIQHAVDLAEAGLDIAGGVYSEVIVADGVYPLTATLVISEAITVHSVNGRAATVIDGQYPAYANRCVLITGDATLDGFAISNGYALATGDDLADPDPLAHRRGGGIYVYGAAANILNCDIVQNRSAQTTGTWGQGGGIALVAANGTVVSNCLVAGNSTMSEGNGTGLFIASSDAFVVQCVVSNNLQVGNSGNGGGFWMNSGTISNSFIVDNYGARYGANRMDGGQVVDCVFSNNWGRSTGGGIEMHGGLLINSTLINNRSGGEGGGGLHLRGGTATGLLIIGNTTTGSGGGVRQNRGVLANSYIIGNHANASGGGVFAADHTIRNCLIAGNNANGAGGGISRGTIGTGHTMQNCTLVRNRAGTVGGGVYTAGSYANVFRNLVVYGNEAGGVPNDADGNHGEWRGNFQNSRADELIDGVNGNLTANPRFRNPGSGFGPDAILGDYMLAVISPCIDAGINQPWMATATDILGDPRIQPADGTVNMGAYETVWDPPKGTMVLFR